MVEESSYDFDEEYNYSDLELRNGLEAHCTPPISYSNEYELDTRNFLPETKALLTTSFSINKSLKNIYKTKTIATTKNYVLNFGENSNTRHTDLSISLSDNRIFDSDFQTVRTLYPLSKFESFRVRCWETFLHFSVKEEVNESSFDSCSLNLPVHQLVSAVSHLCPSVPESVILRNLNEMHYLDRSALSWTEFKDFIFKICDPYVPFSLEGDSNAKNSTLDPHLLPYQRLLEIQRSVSGSVDKIHLEDQSSVSDIFNLSSSQCHDDSVSSHQRDLAIIQVIGNENKARRPKQQEDVVDLQSQESASQMLLVFGDESSTESSPRSKPEGCQKSVTTVIPGVVSFEDYIPHYAIRTEKQTLVGLMQPKHSFPAKWQHMRNLRDARMESDMKKIARHEMLTSLNRLVIASERNSIRTTKEKVRNEVKLSKKEKYNISKQKEDKSSEDKFNFKMSRSQVLSDNAKDLKNALRSSHSLSQQMMEAEVYQKSISKPMLSSLVLSSSSVVLVPEEMTNKKINAKRLSEFNEAKQEIHDYVETTLSQRIGNLVKSKSNIYLPKLATPLSIVPMRSENYFEYEYIHPRPTASAPFLRSLNSDHMGGGVPNLLSARRNSEMDDSIISEAMNEYLRAKSEIEAAELNNEIDGGSIISSRSQDSLGDLNPTEPPKMSPMESLSREYAPYAVSENASMIDKNPWLVDAQYGLIRKKIVLRGL